MSSYLQMGHHSANLLDEEDLNLFSGAILSPVNETEESLAKQINDFQNDKFEMIFDPQLYYPNSNRGHLHNWSYFPGDFDTADYSSRTWWNGLNQELADLLEEIDPTTVCSPAFVPKNFTDGYYEMNNWIADNLKGKIEEFGIDILLTVIARLSDLTEENRAAEISSLITSSNFDRCYLVLHSSTEPRRELNDTDELTGAMRLINYLENSGVRVLVGFCSSDLILWKTAGAQDCSSGKYFNLRRFTPSRWEPPSKGGGQIPYWFEESVMAYLREPDLLRLRSLNFLKKENLVNPYSGQILNLFDKGKGESWLGLSWRQYLYWFSEFENRFNKNKIKSNSFLREAEKVWLDLDEKDILFDEANNDGRWIRRWRKAVVEFNRD